MRGIRPVALRRRRTGVEDGPGPTRADPDRTARCVREAPDGATTRGAARRISPGFFEWPRESTGQEVADSLDVSQPTVNRHLRASQRKLLTMLLDGGSASVE
ncbi:helix-turn-helix domain-containing protein [Halobaculum halobium]|uniref:helix-turn-helix domain-containing protein n=1 Tax=Halobaculum halobium TaxID=3032281 RepID=UPI003613CE54